MARKGDRYLAPLPIVQWRSKYRKTDRHYASLVSVVRAMTGLITADDLTHLRPLKLAASVLKHLVKTGDIEVVQFGRGGPDGGVRTLYRRIPCEQPEASVSLPNAGSAADRKEDAQPNLISTAS